MSARSTPFPFARGQETAFSFARNPQATGTFARSPQATGTFATGALIALLAAGCGAAQVAEVRIDPTKKAASASNEGDSLASILVVDKPEALAIDGDLGEWGNIVPPPPKPEPPPPPKKRSKSPADKASSTDKASPADKASSTDKASPPIVKAQEAPPSPASHIAVAFDSHGVVLAGMLNAEAADGLWFALRLGQLPLLPIGYMTRWGAVQELNCESGPDGSERPPEEVSSCEGVLEAREAFGEGQNARFLRVYRLNRKGLQVVSDSGALVPVEGAKVAFKEGKAGVSTVEVAFPNKALPRTTQAPLAAIDVSARTGSGDKAPPGLQDELGSYDLPSPVGFEPYAALREAAFNTARDHSMMTGLNMSYQPGDALELEDVVYTGGDTMALMTTPKKLFERLTTWNGFEIGYVYAWASAVGVLDKSGGLVGICEITGEPKGIAERDGELHVFSYEQYTPGDDVATHAQWSAIAVQKDGAIRLGLVQSYLSGRWLDPSEFSDPGFTRFGIIGGIAEDAVGGPPPTAHATWTWNSTEKAYGLEVVNEDDDPTPPATGKNKAPPPKAKPASKKKK